jgi:hypothetical protein
VLVKLLRGFAVAWFVLAGLLIFMSTLMIWYEEGFGRVQEIFSPFNVVNFIAVVITLAPGIAARMLADRLEHRRRAARDGGGQS